MPLRAARRAALLTLASAVAGGALTLGAPAAHAVLTSSGALWGPSYGSSVQFAHGSAATFTSTNGVFQFRVQADGNLVAYKQFWTGNATVWDPYWSSRSAGKGYRTSLQNDGNLVSYTSSGGVAWKSDKTQAAGRYNYLLTIQTDGNLVEYYSTGDPRASGRGVLWATGRVPGAITACGGGLIGTGTTNFPVLMAGGGDISAKITNVNVLPLLGDVYRLDHTTAGYKKVNDRSFYVAPYSSATITNFYEGDNLPETITIGTSNVADSALGSLAISGHCWYVP